MGKQIRKNYYKILYCTGGYANDVGHVAQYFREHSLIFYLYLIPAGNNNQPTSFQIYKNGVLLKEDSIFIYRGKNKALIISLYSFYLIYYLIKYNINNTFIVGQNFFFFVFSYLSKKILKNRYVFWIGDYYPSNTGLMSLFHRINNYLISKTENVVFLSPALKTVYCNLAGTRSRGIVTFGVDTKKSIRKPIDGILGHVGILRKGQGIEIMLEVIKKAPKLQLEIVGKGDMFESIKQYIANNHLENRVKLLGPVSSTDLSKYACRWQIGIAAYETSQDSIANYAEPSKAKLYTEYEIPILMTNVTYYADEVRKYKAGEIVEYSVKDILTKIGKIQKNYEIYKKGVVRLKNNYKYIDIYKKGFGFISENEERSAY